MKLNRFEELDCWKEARVLVNQVYKTINPDGSLGKDFQMGAQLQRASCSVMANIVEGFTRRSNKEFTQFLFIATSSAAEVQSHLYIAADQGFISKETFDSIYNQADKTSKMISGLIKYLRTKETRKTR